MDATYDAGETKTSNEGPTAAEAEHATPGPPIKDEPVASPTPTSPPHEAAVGDVDGGGAIDEAAVKTVATSTELDDASIKAPTVNPLDDATMKAIAQAQNEYNTRIRPGKRGSEASSPPPPLPPETPKPVPTKKRPLPKSASAKSSGAKKPAPKKRKVENGSKSVTPARSSPVHESEASPAPSDVTDDGAVYCICRKPDNHTFMIGCDGGCEDWFHGSCVAMRKQDEDLVDKYICPNCVEAGRGVTTWKPMCRRDGCRRPARLRKGAESKYCSSECGVAFMKAKLHESHAAASRPAGLATKPGTPKKARRAHEHAASAADDAAAAAAASDAPEADLGPLGGAIRAHELKALALAAPSASDFQRLGSAGVLTPPRTASPDKDAPSSTADSAVAAAEAPFTPAESARLESISARKDALRAHRALLKDRERFVALAKERAVRAARDLGVKEICGFDARLSWDEVRFARWRDSDAGRSAFARGSLDKAADDSDEPSPAEAPGPAAGGDASAGGGGSAGDDARDPDAALCTRKRCERHRTWQKLATQDVRFEEADVGDEMRRVDAEERAIRERAALRGKQLEHRARRRVRRETAGRDGMDSAPGDHDGGDDDEVEEEEGGSVQVVSLPLHTQQPVRTVNGDVAGGGDAGHVRPATADGDARATGDASAREYDGQS